MEHGPVRSRQRTWIGVDDVRSGSLPDRDGQFVRTSHSDGEVFQSSFQFQIIHCSKTLRDLSTCTIRGNLPYMRTVTLSGRAVPNLISKRQSPLRLVLKSTSSSTFRT